MFNRLTLATVLVALGCALLFTGCGSSGSSVDPVLLAACKDQCATQGTATGCSASFDKTKFVSDCQGMCDSFLSLLPASCTSLYTTMYTCQKGATWECSGDLPQPVNNACQAEMAAAAACK
jgi:hypothetical protein